MADPSRNGASRGDEGSSTGASDSSRAAFERAFDGAVLVADMAGYTRFTEHLVSASADGIDRLGRTIERSFCNYADVVAANGGQIVTLAGDAIVAVWPFAPLGERMATLRAVTCARQLLQCASKHTLSLHAGVATGTVWAGSCAGFERDVDTVFGGAAMRLAFRAARAAPAGEVRVTGRILEQLGQPSASDAAAVLPLPPGVATPAEIRTPREASTQLWNAELRNVAALFVRWRRFDESEAGQWQAHRNALLLAQETTGTSGASGRLVIDDDGLVLVAVFGEPESARLEAPAVIVRRAGTLLEQLRRSHTEVTGGLAFGRVFCGRVECPPSRWKVSVGPALNLAARLMDRAGTGLLVAGVSAERTPDGLVAQGEPLRLRGIDESVSVFRYDARAEAKPEVVLFERDEELARVAALLDAAMNGAGVTCLVRGDAGVGKTALLSAIEVQSERAGVVLARGAAQTNERASQYYAWRRILRDLVPAAAMREPSALLGHLERIGVDPALAPLLNSVFHSGYPATPVSERLSGKARAEATLELIFTLVKHAVRTPTLITLEDVQFADPASIELLERVALQLSNLLVVITARPAASTSALIYRLSGPRYHQIDLKPLTRSGIEAMVRFELKGPSSASLIDCIEEASQGNALFALEYLRLLHDRGRVADDRGEFRLTEPLDATTVPSTVIGAVSSRIHALHPREQRLLKIASVLGPSFSRDLLHRLAPDYETRELDAILSNLERNGLVVQESLRDNALVFSHDLIRDAAYETLLHEQKRSVHAEVARILEQRREQQIRSILPRLVHHHASAGDDAHVVKYGELAALEAIKQGSFADAIEFLQMCLASAAKLPAYALEPGAYVRWHRWLAEAAGAIGVLRARREHAREAVTLAGVRLASSHFAARLATAWSLLRRIVRGMPVAKRALPARASSAHEVDIAQAFHELAFASYFSGEGDWFLYYVLKALAHAERGGDRTQIIEFSTLAGACIGYIGLERTGRKYMAAAHLTGATPEHDQAVAAGHMHCALYLIGRGAWDEVVQHLDECQQSCRKLGSNYQWGNAQIIRFWLHWYRGQRDVAEEVARELLLAAERSGNRQQLLWAHRSLGLVRRCKGELDRAIAHMEIAQSLLPTDADLNEAVQVLGSAAELHLVRGDVTQAAALSSCTLERLLHVRRFTGHALLEGCSGIVCVTLQLWELEPNDLERRDRARQALRVLDKYASVFPIGWPRYHYWHGRWLRACGKRRAAARAFRRARAAARQYAVGYEFTMVGDRFRESAPPRTR